MISKEQGADYRQVAKKLSPLPDRWLLAVFEVLNQLLGTIIPTYYGPSPKVRFERGGIYECTEFGIGHVGIHAER